MISDPSIILQREMQPNERLLWSGRPPGGVMLHVSDLLSLSSIPAAIFVLVVATKTVRHPFFLFLTVWIIIITSYNLVGRFLVDAAWREHSYYAVTDQRILIVTRLFGVRVKSLELRALPEPFLKEGSNGAGTITFGRAMNVFQLALRGGRGSPPRPPRFQSIPAAREVFYLIQQAQASASTSSTSS